MIWRQTGADLVIWSLELVEVLGRRQQVGNQGFGLLDHWLSWPVEAASPSMGSSLVRTSVSWRRSVGEVVWNSMEAPSSLYRV